MNLGQKLSLAIAGFFLLIIPALFSIYFIIDRGEVILNSSYQTAVLESCKSERIKSVPRRRQFGQTKTFHRAYARTEDGNIIKARLALASKEQCRKKIGETVKVFVHNKDEDRSRLNTVLQFWLSPLVWLTLTIAFWGAVIDGFRKGYWKLK